MMTQAEIITIGTELLLGEIQDTNTRYLARQLRHIGIDLYRVSIIGDNPLRIADMIRESLIRADIVITTGGLGPTIDDPTRNAAAIAFNVEMIFHADLWKQIFNRFQTRGIIPSDNNKKQAYLPVNAIAIHNPVGTAPAFYIADKGKLVVCLPGVPAEMYTIFEESVIPLLREQFSLYELIKTRVIHTSGIGESQVDDIIADLETSSNPTVGLSAHPASVDIRITAKASSEEEAKSMIREIENKVIERLPRNIFGFDDDTLIGKIIDLAKEKKVIIHLFVHGFKPQFFSKMEPKYKRIINTKKIDQPFSAKGKLEPVAGKACFAANFEMRENVGVLELLFICPDMSDVKVRTFNGPPTHIDKWMENTVMDFIWHKLAEEEKWSAI